MGSARRSRELTAMTLPDPARYAMDAAAAIGADYADLDQGGGYLFRISRNASAGRRRGRRRLVLPDQQRNRLHALA